jgi:hypothetical protein
MTLLEEFVFALSKTQRAKLRPLQFRGIKRKIFLKILTCRSRTGIDTTTILRSQSKRRYYQMLSEMLSACYRDVAPRGGIQLLQFLGNNQLFRHLYSELKRQEAVVLEKGDRKAIEQYYFDALLVAHFFTVPFNGKAEEELAQYPQRYMQAKKYDSTDVYLQRIYEIRERVYRLGTHYNNEQALRYFGELVATFDKVKSTDNFLAKLSVTLQLISYSGRLIQSHGDAFYYLQFAQNMLKQSYERFGITGKFFELYLDLERARLSGEPLDIPRHKTNFSATSSSMGFPLNTMYRLFPYILHAGDLALAKSYIQKYFPLKIELVSSQVACFYWDLLMLYHIYTGRYSEAEQYLQHALRSNVGKARYINLELYLRRFEIFLTGMRGDPVTMDHLIKKCNRYALAHGFNRTSLMQTFTSLIKCIGIDPVRAQAIRDEYLRAENQHFLHRMMFDRIYAKYFPKKYS